MSVQDRISSLSPAHKALLEKLVAEKRRAAATSHAPPSIPRASGPDGAGDWPLSFDQERLWILSQLDPEGTAYNLLSVTRLGGALDVPALHGALCEIFRRQGAWRTTFPAVDGVPVQRVAPAARPPLPVVDLTALSPVVREATAQVLVRAATRQPFSLERGPLARVLLLRLDAREHVCLVAVHHIVSDQITFHLFWRELISLYAAFSAGRPRPLPEPPVQYADYVVWQRGWLQGETLSAALDWWQGQLRDFSQVLELPADRPRPATESIRGGQLPLRIEPGLTHALRELARGERVTRFMVVAALAATLFQRLSGQEKLITGTLNANRNRIELEPLFGFFLTQLPLALDLSGDPPFREVLGRVRATALGAYAHQDLPFGKLVEVMQPERTLGRMPLVQTLVQLFDLQAAPPADPGLGLRVEPIPAFDGNTRYDVMLALADDVDAIHGPLEYNAEIFDAATAARMVELFLAQAAAVAADPVLPLSALPAFPPALRQQVLREWNDTADPAPAATVVELFAAQAERTPQALAWTGDGWSLTYAELAERAGRLAHHLRRRGAGPEDLIGIFLERSAELPVALLGVLQSGAAYLPLDIAHPAERRAFVLEDAGAALVLTQERLLGQLPAGITTVCLDAEWEDIGPIRPIRPIRPISSSLPPPGPDSRAYVIYTSGSTGRPKGVEIPHRALASFVHAMRRLYRVEAGDAMPAITTIAFDLSVPELYLPMLGGGTTPLLARDTAADGSMLARALDDQGATVLQATPATYRLLLEAGWAGRPELLLLCGAEAMSRDLADQLLPLGRGLWNFYGPTETTVWSTAWRVEPGVPIAIGRPIAGTRIYLLDRRFAPVPAGAVGEIAIGGAGLARGYLRRPDLTADRFVPDPFADPLEEPGARLYRTGDLGRLRHDGLLEHLGRADHQIKLRGYRIEPGEIEAALRAHPGVSEAVVMVCEDRLVAWLGLAPGAAAPEQAELRERLRRDLPEYMVPAAFVPLPSLPRNANGKLDRKALPAPEGAAGHAGREIVAPRTATETEVVALWQRLLGVERVGVFDNFFELGGHSLLANRVVAAVRQSFDVEIPLRALFQEPTVAGLAAAVDRAKAGDAEGVVRIERQPRLPGEAQRFPCSFSQIREWILDRLEPGTPAYNVPMPMRVTGPLSIPVLLASVQEIVRRHDALRTTFESGPEEPLQVVAPHLELPVGIADLAALPAPRREAELRRLLLEDLDLGFDLGFPQGGPLLRARLVRLGAEDHAGLFTLHHSISDGWSIGVFLRDLGALYEAFAAGRPSPLPELPLQYPDFAVWQRNRLQGAVLAEQTRYWRERLAGAPPVLELPADRPRPAVRTSRGAELPAALPRPLVEAMRSLAVRQGGSLFMALLAGWQTLLARLSGEDDVCVGTFSGNRPRVELEGLIGFFVNTLVLRTELSGTLSFRGLLRRVAEVTLGAYAHQEIPFEKLLESLDVPRDPARTPLFQTMLVLQNFPRQGIELSRITLAPLVFESQRANFDVTLWLSEASDRSDRSDRSVGLSDGSPGLAGHVDFSTDLFEAVTIERLLGQLRTLLEAAVAEPGRDLRDLPLLAPAERAAIVEGWSRTVAEPAGEVLLHRLFEEQAAFTPDAVAVETIDGSERLTYAGLDALAERLARHLRSLGVGPDTRVGLSVERSPEMLVGMLGILKAGGAYVPLDPAYPQDRLDFMREDSGAALLLTQERLAQSLESLESLESFQSFAFSPEQAAYLIYTSGSTGRPKGVVVPHRSIAAYTRTARAFYEIHPADRVLQFGSISFDTSAEEIWPALAAGATLVLRSAEMSLSIERFLAELERRKITVLNLQTAFWHEVVAGLSAGLALPPAIRLVIIGGEAALPDRLAAWRERVGSRVRLVNTYGPTEATIVATHRDLTHLENDREVPIGRPIPGARVYLVDPRGEPVPPLVPGELLIGGAGVARGYLGRPDLTAERFVPDPWSSEPGARLYRSGDLARFRIRGGPGGELLFCGRADRQLKVRGYRIEPGEIEAALRRHPALHDAVAGVRGGADDPRLIAWVVPSEGRTAPEGPELRAFLRERLPEPLIPSLFVPLAALPVTPGGKLDRRALPEPAAVRPELPGYAEPSTALERTIANLFRELLRVDRVGLHDNFFDLGGHSLLIVRAHQKLGEELQRDIPVVDLFRFPTVALLARHLGGDAAPTFERVQSLAEQQRAAQMRQKQALEKLRRPGGAPRR